MESIDLKSTKVVRHNPRPSAARSDAARRNGARSHGRPRVSMDWVNWNRLAFGGASDKAIADALGISYRTFKRRKTDRLRQTEPM